MVNNPVCSKTLSKFTGREIFELKQKRGLVCGIISQKMTPSMFSLQHHPGVYDHGQLFSLPLLPDNIGWRTE